MNYIETFALNSMFCMFAYFCISISIKEAIYINIVDKLKGCAVQLPFQNARQQCDRKVEVLDHYIICPCQKIHQDALHLKIESKV